MDELKARAAVLAKDVEELTASVNRLADRQAAAENRNRLLGLALFLVAALTVAMGFVALRAETAIADGVELRQEVFCPIFDLVVGGYDPESRPPGPDRDAYERNAQVMREGRAVLNCSGELVPPRVEG